MGTILVTGAAGGIGRAIVDRLASEGLSIFACDKDAEGLKQLVAEVRSKFSNIKVESEVFDISDCARVQSFGEILAQRVSGLAGLINNAGIYLGRDLFDYSVAEMQSVIAVNLFAAIQLSQTVGKILVKAQRKGTIVNVSSVSAFEGSSDALYGVTKAGLIGLTKSCALTFAPYVRVNAVAPGLVDTTMIQKIPKWRLDEFEKSERLKGRISPQAVAAAIWFLMSEESRHTTGSVIDLNNGGYLR